MTSKPETGASESGAQDGEPHAPETPEDGPQEGASGKIDPDAVKKALEAHLDTSPDLLARVFEQRTMMGADALSGEDPIPRSYAEFIMDHTVCAPGLFPGDFKIKLQSLTSSEEIHAMRGVDDPMAVATVLAKASIYALNGTPIKSSDQKDFLWEAISSGGRQVVQNMFAQMGFAPQRALGKAIASTTIS